jgi:DNA-binding NarL/FixJ family response regulator
MKLRIRLIVVDDHPVVRDGLKGMLASQPDLEVAGEAANGEEAVALAGRLHPDVVLMDLRMPIMDGTTATRRLRCELPQCRVIMLSTFDDEDSRARGLEAGAVAYLLKDTPLDDLVEAIRCAAAPA